MNEENEMNSGVGASRTKQKKSTFISGLIGFLLALLAVFAFLLAKAAVSASFTIAITAANRGTDIETITNTVLEQTSLSSIIESCVALSGIVIILKLTKRKVRDTLKMKSFPLLSVIPLILLGEFLNFCSESALTLIPVPDSLMDFYDYLYSFLGKGNAAIEFISVVVAAPIIEEIVFRGLAYGVMKHRMNRTAAIIISAALFGAAHGNPVSFFFTFILGIVLAVSYDAGGSIFVPIIIHASFNGASYLAQKIFPDETWATYLIICIGSFIAAVAADAAAYHICRRSAQKLNYEPDEKTSLGTDGDNI